MFISRKVRAFTLFELLVVMLISTILMGIVYYALQVANNSYTSFARDTSKLLGLKTLVHTLQHDVERADEVIADSDELWCHSEQGVIAYTIGDTFVRRTVNGIEEEFPYGPDTYGFSFQQMAVRPLKEPVDGIELTFIIKKETLHFSITRNGSFYDRFVKFNKRADH